MESLNCRKDGTKFQFECSIAAIADEKRKNLLNEIQSTNSDIIELNQRLEIIRAEREMSLTALAMAYMIKSPAHIMVRRCRRMLAGGELSEEFRQNLQYILEGAESLDTIVKNMGDFLKSRKILLNNDDLKWNFKSTIPVSGKEAKDNVRYFMNNS